MNVKIIALGGGASNAVNQMIRAGDIAADFIAANTDVQDLKRSKAPTRLQVGAALVKGLGAGGDAEIGRAAAEADREAIALVLAGAQLVIVVAALGGGTGSGGASVICQVAKAGGAVVVSVVTLPLPFEGRRRRMVADAALTALDGSAPDRNVVVEIPIPPREDGVSLAGMFALTDAAVAAEVRSVISGGLPGA